MEDDNCNNEIASLGSLGHDASVWREAHPMFRGAGHDTPCFVSAPRHLLGLRPFRRLHAAGPPAAPPCLRDEAPVTSTAAPVGPAAAAAATPAAPWLPTPLQRPPTAPAAAPLAGS